MEASTLWPGMQLAHLGLVHTGSAKVLVAATAGQSKLRLPELPQAARDTSVGSTSSRRSRRGSKAGRQRHGDDESPVISSSFLANQARCPTPAPPADSLSMLKVACTLVSLHPTPSACEGSGQRACAGTGRGLLRGSNGSAVVWVAHSSLSVAAVAVVRALPVTDAGSLDTLYVSLDCALAHFLGVFTPSAGSSIAPRGGDPTAETDLPSLLDRVAGESARESAAYTAASACQEASSEAAWGACADARLAALRTDCLQPVLKGLAGSPGISPPPAPSPGMPPMSHLLLATAWPEPATPVGAGQVLGGLGSVSLGIALEGEESALQDVVCGQAFISGPEPHTSIARVASALLAAVRSPVDSAGGVRFRCAWQGGISANVIMLPHVGIVHVSCISGMPTPEGLVAPTVMAIPLSSPGGGLPLAWLAGGVQTGLPLPALLDVVGGFAQQDVVALWGGGGAKQRRPSFSADLPPGGQPVSRPAPPVAGSTPDRPGRPSRRRHRRRTGRQLHVASPVLPTMPGRGFTSHGSTGDMFHLGSMGGPLVLGEGEAGSRGDSRTTHSVTSQESRGFSSDSSRQRGHGRGGFGFSTTGSSLGSGIAGLRVTRGQSSAASSTETPMMMVPAAPQLMQATQGSPNYPANMPKPPDSLAFLQHGGSIRITLISSPAAQAAAVRLPAFGTTALTGGLGSVMSSVVEE